MAKYKLLVIDDEFDRRSSYYETVLGGDDFALSFVHSPSELDNLINEPVDGYIIDIFLDRGDWKLTASEVIDNYIIPPLRAKESEARARSPR